LIGSPWHRLAGREQGAPVAYYLVHARPRAELLPALEDGLRTGIYRKLEPFGRALSASLRDARLGPDGRACWEEEDYCRPPLAQERAAVLDRHFADITVEAVEQGAGWRQIAALPRLFPAMALPIAVDPNSGLEQE
jgi:hypothetical protein